MQKKNNASWIGMRGPTNFLLSMTSCFFTATSSGEQLNHSEKGRSGCRNVDRLVNKDILTTCLETPDISGNYLDVRVMSGLLVKISELSVLKKSCLGILHKNFPRDLHNFAL